VNRCNSSLWRPLARFALAAAISPRFIVTRNKWRDEMIKRDVARYNDLPSTEVNGGLIDIVDGGHVAQKEHGLLIEVYDHAGLLQRLRSFWFISAIGSG
jgi:hypothetical protein